MPDHVHLLLSIPPKMSASSFIGYLEGKSTMILFERHANLKYKLGNKNIWAVGYYVSTVGLNESIIKKYIYKNKKKEDKIMKKEYKNPFKG